MLFNEEQRINLEYYVPVDHYLKEVYIHLES